jgi:glycosyltransferase involved in cell wall biosynthesis
MTLPGISCIIIADNSAAHLHGALESVFSQTYTPTEIIIADAGSTDGTRELARAFGEWVRLVWHPGRPRDLALARRLGVRAATGDFIAFLDPRARWHPTKLARQLARFDDDHSLDISLTLVSEDARAPSCDDALAHASAGTTALARRELMMTSRGLRRVDQMDHHDARDGLRVELLQEALTYLPAPVRARTSPPAAWHQSHAPRALSERRGTHLERARAQNSAPRRA